MKTNSIYRQIVLTLVCICSFNFLERGASAEPAASSTPATFTNGVFGQAYDLKTGFEFTMVSAEYSVGAVNGDASVIPQANDKLLVLHYKLKNLQATDNTYDRHAANFTAIDAKGQSHDGGTDPGRTSTGKAMDPDLKAGAEYDDVYTALVVPAKGAVTKVTYNQGCVDTSDSGISFVLGSDKNVITALPDFVRDPDDSSGVSTLPLISAKPGDVCPMNQVTVTLGAVTFADTFNGADADDGNRYIILNFTMKNQTATVATVTGGAYTAKLTDADGTDTPIAGIAQAHVDEDIGDKALNCGEQVSCRLWLQVAKTAKLSTFTISEGGSRAYQFDLSSYK